jgi:hypothetical protein
LTSPAQRHSGFVMTSSFFSFLFFEFCMYGNLFT